MAERTALRGAAAGQAATESTPRLSTRDFDYPLDAGLVAQRPLPDRDTSRLLVTRRAGGALEDRTFREVVGLVSPGDVLVLNDTRVFPARLLGRKPTGAAAEVLLIEPLDAAGARWRALVRPGGKLKPGRVVEVADDLLVEIGETLPGGARAVRLLTPLPVSQALARYGRIPLPPYIRREDDQLDRERYQTVYAREDGSVAAPTAGLHFTESLLAEIRGRGVAIAGVTLHVGPATFRPVEVDDPAEHRLDPEWYRVTPEAAEIVNEARACGGAVWAVGTTAVRTLETASDEGGVVRPGAGATDLFIRPGYRFRVVDRLVTNFHLPRSTLLMLVAAFAGYELTMAAYRHAQERRYRFYSYGDAMAVI
jgi:S-adenosylmethionine:tRNA ribosyltransferase-isomerase